jgi:hypothetical protein
MVKWTARIVLAPLIVMFMLTAVVLLTIVRTYELATGEDEDYE